MRRLLWIGTLLVVIAAPPAIYWIGQHRLAEFDASWRSDAGGDQQRRQLTEALARYRALEGQLLGRLRAAAESPRLQGALQKSPPGPALQRAMARLRPANAPESFEIRDDAGRCLAWSGHPLDRPRPGSVGPEPRVRIVEGPLLRLLVAGQQIEHAGRQWTVELIHPLPVDMTDPEHAQTRTAALWLAGDDEPAGGDPERVPFGWIAEEMRSSGGQRWIVGAPELDSDFARQRLVQQNGLLLLVALAILVLAAAAGVVRLIEQSALPAWARLGGLVALLAGLAGAVYLIDLVNPKLPQWLVALPEWVVGQSYYSDSGEALHKKLTQSPLTLMVTLLTGLGFTVAARRMVRPAGPPPSVSRAWRIAGVVAALLGCAGLVGLFCALVTSIVSFKFGVTFFPDDRVIPHWKALVLEGALFLGALITVLGCDLALLIGRRLLTKLVSPGRIWAVLLAGAAAAIVGLVPLAGETSRLLLAFIASLIWFAALLLNVLRGYRPIVRVLVVLLATGALVYPTLARAIHDSLVDYAADLADTYEWEIPEPGSFKGEARRVGMAVAGIEDESIDPDLGYKLWSTNTLSGYRFNCHLRILGDNGSALSEFKLGMPPAHWYLGQLQMIEARPVAPDPQPVRLRVGRGRFDLGLSTVVSEVEAEGPGKLRISLTRPVLEDRLLPATAFPRVLPFAGGGAQNPQVIHLTRDATGRVRSSFGSASQASLPAAPEPGVTRVEQRLMGREATLFVQPGPEGTPDEGTVSAIGVLRPNATTSFLNYVRLLLTFICLSLFGVPIVLARHLWRRRSLWLGIERRLLGAFVLLSFLPLIWLAGLSQVRARRYLEQTREQALSSALHQLSAQITDRLGDGSPESRLDDAWCQQTSAQLGRMFFVYQNGKLVRASHPELAQIGLIPLRPPIGVNNAIMLRGAGQRYGTLRFGDRRVPIGYAAVLDHQGRPAGIVATLSLAEPGAIEKEQVRSTLLSLAIYGLVLLGVVLFALLLARRISLPVEKLLEGTRQIAGGNLRHQIAYDSGDEFGELVSSFNQMTAQVLVTQDKLVDAERNEAMGTMARQIAHEIKNPLTPMKLSAQHLRDAYDRDHPKFEEILDKTSRTIVEQVEALHRIASEFSTYAQFPRRKPEPIDLHELLSEVGEMYQGFEERVTVVSRLGDDLPPVRADRDELRRIFINLMTNAVQAIDGEGRVILTTGRTLLAPVDHQASQTGKSVPCIEAKVIDSGVGIPEENLQKIFVPNFSTKTRGTGIGLAICKKSIDEMGGEISIQSSVGEGTTVSVVLPIAKESEDDEEE